MLYTTLLFAHLLSQTPAETNPQTKTDQKKKKKNKQTNKQTLPHNSLRHTPQIYQSPAFRTATTQNTTRAASSKSRHSKSFIREGFASFASTQQANLGFGFWCQSSRSKCEREREKKTKKRMDLCAGGACSRARLVAPASTEVRQRIRQRTPASTKVRYFNFKKTVQGFRW
jgi:phage major head subunit gpT-like protein